MKRILGLFLFVLFVNCPAAITQIDTSSFSKTFTQSEYLEDLNQFVDTILGTHPHPYKFTSKADFQKTIEEKKRLLSDSTTLPKFIWHCSEIITKLGCGHSSLGWFNQEDALLPMKLRFPLEAKLIEDRLYISDPLLNKGKIEAGQEIFSINGLPISLITAEAFKHINSQAQIPSYKRLLFSGYITSYIPYVLNFPKTYQITVKGQKNPIQLNPLQAYRPKPRYQRIVSNSNCKEELCLTISNENTAVLTLRNFAYYGDRFPIYRSFIDEAFSEIQAKEIQHLIIDLRFNGGGPSVAANHLLKYLVEGPYTYFRHNDFEHLTNEQQPNSNAFKGQTYFLIDGDGHSTTGHFMSLVKELKLGIIIGEELGSNQFCTANQKRYSMPHTGISYSVARNTFITTAASSLADHGILPDHFVTQSIHDHLDNIDTVLEYALELIEQK